MTIRFHFGNDLDLEFSRSNVEFAISQPKMIRLPWNKKQTYWLNSRHLMWPFGLNLAMTLTLSCQGQLCNLLYLSQKWCNCPQNEKRTYRLDTRPQMQPSILTLVMTLTLIFKVKFSQEWQGRLTLSVIHDHDCDLLETKLSCKDLPDSDQDNFRCRRAVDLSSCRKQVSRKFHLPSSL